MSVRQPTGPTPTGPTPPLPRSGPLRVERRRRIAATDDVVWRHVTGSSWLGLDDDDPRIGDRLQLPDPFGGGGPRQGRVLGVRSGRSVVIEWWPDGRPDDRSTVAISLSPADGGTTVSVVEEALPTADLSTRGRVWSSCLQALAGAVERTRSPFALSAV